MHGERLVEGARKRRPEEESDLSRSKRSDAPQPILVANLDVKRRVAASLGHLIEEGCCRAVVYEDGALLGLLRVTRAEVDRSLPDLHLALDDRADQRQLARRLRRLRVLEEALEPPLVRRAQGLVILDDLDRQRAFELVAGAEALGLRVPPPSSEERASSLGRGCWLRGSALACRPRRRVRIVRRGASGGAVLAGRTGARARRVRRVHRGHELDEQDAALARLQRQLAVALGEGHDASGALPRLYGGAEPRVHPHERLLDIDRGRCGRVHRVGRSPPFEPRVEGAAVVDWETLDGRGGREHTPR